MESDPVCIQCGCHFNPGLSQRKLAQIMGGLAAGGMLVMINLAVPRSADDWLANAVTTGLFCGAAGVAGSVFGWVLGAFICEI
jgi:hypothetical protein